MIWIPYVVLGADGLPLPTPEPSEDDRLWRREHTAIAALVARLHGDRPPGREE